MVYYVPGSATDISNDSINHKKKKKKQSHDKHSTERKMPRCHGGGSSSKSDAELQRQDETAPTFAAFTQTKNSPGVLAKAKFTRLQEVN